MKYIKEYIDFDDFDFEEESMDNKVIVFDSGGIIYCGKIVRQFGNYRLEILETTTDDFDLGIIGRIYKKVDDVHLVITKLISHSKLTMFELKTKYDVIIVDSEDVRQDILDNPQKYLYEDGN